MDKLGKALILGEITSYGALGALARTMAESVDALFVGNVMACGADRGLLIEQEESICFEGMLSNIVEGVRYAAPDIVLISCGRQMRLVAACIAASFGTSVLNDATSLALDEKGHVVSEKLVHGGSAICKQRVDAGVAVVVVADSLLADVEPCTMPVFETICLEGVVDADNDVISLIRREERQVESVNLAAAKRVVSIGRGISAEADLALVREFATCLEAEIGCTRPISEGNGWLARERYIGVSGAIIKPDVFVALGLSGQIQHMVGAESARTIFAINKDKNAPIFKYADYGIVGDLYDIVPKLIEELR